MKVYQHPHITLNTVNSSIFNSFSEKRARRSVFNILPGFSIVPGNAIIPIQRCRKMHLGSRQFHYAESSCFSSGSRPLCRLPSTENWKHGTNNIMCYSNFAPGLVICPSAVTSVADRADVPVSPPVLPRRGSP